MNVCQPASLPASLSIYLFEANASGLLGIRACFPIFFMLLPTSLSIYISVVNTPFLLSIPAYVPMFFMLATARMALGGL
jgi:hypothetical protein